LEVRGPLANAVAVLLLLSLRVLLTVPVMAGNSAARCCPTSARACA
jgi:hypothetical protein